MHYLNLGNNTFTRDSNDNERDFNIKNHYENHLRSKQFSVESFT